MQQVYEDEMERLKVGMQGATDDSVQDQTDQMKKDLEQKLREAAKQAEKDMQVTTRIMDKLKEDVAQKEIYIEQITVSLLRNAIAAKDLGSLVKYIEETKNLNMAPPPPELEESLQLRPKLEVNFICPHPSMGKGGLARE